MVICGQRLVEIVIGQLTSPFVDLKYDDLYGYNQETDSDKGIARIEEFAGRAKRAISGTQRIKILKVIKEVETKLDIETKLVMEIETPLDIITITL